MFNRFAIIVFVVTLIVYLLFAGRFQFNFPKTNRDYFTRLSESFSQGKLDIPYPGYTPNDLSYFKNKYYLYWGPLSALILLPITTLFGTQVSDILYTVFFGSLNSLLIYLLFLEFQKFTKLKISQSMDLLLAFCFAFGSIHFYLSILGTVWFTSQILTLSAYLFSLFFLFKYLNDKKSLYVFLSIFFLGASTLGKYTFLLSVPLHFGLVFVQNRKSVALMIKLSALLFVFIAMTLLYNYVRFGSILNNGLSLMQINSRFFDDIQKYGYFHVVYIFRNLYYLLLNPLRMSTSNPYILPNPNGNSIFYTSPIFLVILYGLFKGFFQKNKRLFTVIVSTAVCMLLPVLLYYGGGWYQWGFRYALDIYPLLFLLILMAIPRCNKRVVYILVFLSIFINIYGTLWMMDFAKYAYF